MSAIAELVELGEMLQSTPYPSRVLVTGSRTWTDEKAVDFALALVDNRAKWEDELPITLVHGGAGRGLDRIARDWAALRRPRWEIESHSAEWDKYGRRAGMVRNAEMVAAGAVVCLAFIHNASPGATACAQMAEKAGIPTWRCAK